MRGAVLGRVAAIAATAACSGEQSTFDVCDEGLCAPGTLTFGARAQSYTASAVEAVAVTPDEPPWFAGTFNADVTIDDTSIPWDDAGYFDPFVARTGVERLAPLVIGSSAAHAQRVVAVVPDAEDGATLYSIGQLVDTRHLFEAVWFDRGGQLIARDTVAMIDVPGALGGVAVTTDERGWPIVAVSGTRIDLDGQVREGAHGLVMRLGQGFSRDVLVDLDGVDIADVEVDDDLLVIGGSYTGAPEGPPGSAPWPACADPDPCGFVAVVALSSGLVHWVQPIRATGGAAVHVVGAGSGQVVAMASTQGVASDPPLGTTAIPAYLMTFDAVGSAGLPLLLDQTILADDRAVVGRRSLDVADNGATIVALAYRGDVLVGRSPLAYPRDDGTWGSVVAELGTDLIWQWDLYLLDRNVEVRSVDARGNQVAFGGLYRGAISLFNPLGVTLPGSTELLSGEYADNGFVLEVHR